jgi:hypothetical protein
MEWKSITPLNPHHFSNSISHAVIFGLSIVPSNQETRFGPKVYTSHRWSVCHLDRLPIPRRRRQTWRVIYDGWLEKHGMCAKGPLDNEEFAQQPGGNSQ